MKTKSGKDNHPTATDAGAGQTLPRPAAPGWWWWRAAEVPGMQEWHPRKVIVGNGHLLECSELATDDKTGWWGEWAGPLTPPPPK